MLWNKLDESLRLRVHEHINHLPVTVSHYTQSKAPRKRYMEESTTIEKLYQKYVKWMTDNYPNETMAEESSYSHCFTHDYNIVTNPPMKNTCSTCDTTSTNIKLEEELGNDTTSLKEELLTHKNKARDAHNYIKKMQEDISENRCVLAIDLQQTLPCLRIPTGKAYYIQKLWCYNFCIHDVKQNIIIGMKLLLHVALMK